MPGPASGPRSSGPGRGLPAAGRVPVRRAGIPAGLGPADGRAGRAGRRGPDRVRDDPGAPPSRARAAARAVRPAGRPVPGGSTLAGAAGGRDRRHDHDRRGQRGEPGRLLQAARRPDRRVQLPGAATAGLGQLRDPHRHRRRVRARHQRRDHLRPGPARQPARGHGPARRPELRSRVPGRSDRGNRGGLPDPGPHREQGPGTPRPAAGATTGPGCRASAASRSGSSTRRSSSRPAPAALPPAAGWSPPCSTRPATPPASWPRSTTSAGRSRPPTSSSSRPSSAAASCAPAPRTGSSRKSGPCWSPTRRCAPPSPTPPAPSRAPTPTGPASPSP